MSEAITPEYISQIAAILAKGFLRYWKAQRQRSLIAESRVDSPAPESRHGTVVDAKEREKC